LKNFLKSSNIKNFYLKIKNAIKYRCNRGDQYYNIFRNNYYYF